MPLHVIKNELISSNVPKKLIFNHFLNNCSNPASGKSHIRAYWAESPAKVVGNPPMSFAENFCANRRLM